MLVLVRAHSEIGNRCEGLIGFHVSHREGGAVFSRVGDQQSPRPMSFIAPFPRGTLSAVLACKTTGGRAHAPAARWHAPHTFAPLCPITPVPSAATVYGAPVASYTH